LASQTVSNDAYCQGAHREDLLHDGLLTVKQSSSY